MERDRLIARLVRYALLFVAVGLALTARAQIEIAQVPAARSAVAARIAPAQRWACAPDPASARSPFRLYVLHDAGHEIWPGSGPSWGNDPAERGPTRLSRLDPGSGATLAHANEPAVGFAYDPGSGRVARMAFRPEPYRSPSVLELAGFEVLDADSLGRVGFFGAAPLFPLTQLTLREGNLALAGGGNRLAVVERMGANGPASFRTPTVGATCLDLSQRAASVGRVMGSDFAKEAAACSVPRLAVRPADDGSLTVLATLCGAKLRWYRIDAQARVAHHDLPFKEYQPAFGVSPDGARLFVADPRRQELYAVAADSGRVLWQQRYGAPPPAGHKYAAAPNQIEVAPSGARLYLISNPTSAPGHGVWVIDAETGRVQAHLVEDVLVSGIAVSPADDLYIASPDGGGRLWVLPHGDLHQARLLRDDLGDRLSGVLVGA